MRLSPTLPSWSAEARGLITLAIPLILGNVAWSLIAATDLLLLGRLGPDAVGAGALAINLYHGFLIFGMGLGTAVSAMIARERGRRAHSVREIRRSVRQSIWTVASLCPPMWAIFWHSETILIALGQDPGLAAQAARIMNGLQWALLPYLVFFVLRNFIGALERPIWGVVIMGVALPVNYLLGWGLIFGHLGLPALGLFGAGLASSLTTLFMAIAIIAIVLLDRQFRRYHLFGRFWAPDWPRFAQVWQLGLPIAITLALEVTVFNASTFLMGLLGRAPLAAHAIALQISALCFMVPMGVGQAATVRVGLRFGRNDRPGAGRAGWIALILGVGFAAATGLLLILAPRPLIAIFLDVRSPANAQVVGLAVSYLAVAALFQLVDCTQVIGAGVLRGLHDTRVPMLFAATGYWIIGIGTGVFLAFRTPMAGLGIWIGLAVGLAVVACLMVWRWSRRERLGLI
ncbi:MAG: MATE family efflux transporter [Sphingobium sp.]